MKTEMNSWLDIQSGLEVVSSLYMDNRQTSSSEQLPFESTGWDLLDWERVVSAYSGKVEHVTQDLRFILSTEVYRRRGNIVFEISCSLFRNSFK